MAMFDMGFRGYVTRFCHRIRAQLANSDPVSESTAGRRVLRLIRTTGSRGTLRHAPTNGVRGVCEKPRVREALTDTRYPYIVMS
jgi:hypothetical protein